MIARAVPGRLVINSPKHGTVRSHAAVLLAGHAHTRCGLIRSAGRRHLWVGSVVLVPVSCRSCQEKP